MPKLYSSNQIKNVLKKFNFNLISRKGSHGKFKNSSGKTVILPMNKKKIPKGTFNSILKQANITQKEFEDNV